MMLTPVIPLDTETTGTDRETARIVTAYVGVLDTHGRITDEEDMTVQPDGFDIPDEATQIHGITTAHAHEHGMPLDDALGRLGWLLARHPDLPLAGQNIAFDLTIIDREWRRARPTDPDGFIRLLGDRPMLDSLVLDRQLDRYRRGSRALTALAAHYGVELAAEEAHGARADAIAAGRIVQKLMLHPDLAGVGISELHDRQVLWHAEQAASREEWLRTRATPPQRDVRVPREWPLIPYAVKEATAA